MAVDLLKAVNDLRQLDAQQPESWPDWVRVAAAVLLAAAIAGGTGWFLIEPMYQKTASARQQETQLRRDVESKQRRAALLDAGRADLHRMQREFGRMLHQLPGSAEVAALLQDISRLRVASGLDEALFEPRPERMHGFYAELPHRIVVSGGYHDLGRFVSDVAALPRIVTIGDVEIAPEGSRLRMTAVAKTYRFPDDDDVRMPVEAVRSDPLPQLDRYAYRAGNRRAPFAPQQPARPGRAADGPRPDAARPRQTLEGFALDALQMVGLVIARNQRFALLRDPENVIHRVPVGGYAGQNHGRIVAVENRAVRLVELVPDGSGGWRERSAVLPMDGSTEG